MFLNCLWLAILINDAKTTPTGPSWSILPSAVPSGARAQMNAPRRKTAMATAPITRFAPSPTGRLHLGHAFSALVASRLGGGYRLRIDDIDHTRCRPGYTEQIYEDLTFLGLPWRGEPVFQSDRLDRYSQALDRLREMDLV